MDGVKGYKVFNPDWTCQGFKYEVGKIYEIVEEIKVCEVGFHFCKQIKDCFNYYPFNPMNKVAEILALGKVIEKNDKCCTNKIKIVREVTWLELLTIVNTGKACTGFCNSGNYNSGNYNSGYRNSGNWNSGNYNSGNYNSGALNSGYRNNGDYNSGNYNSGNGNSGDCNSGDWNSGNYNSGNGNSGDYNSGNGNNGDCNSGNYNSGNWNSGNWNSGDWNKASNVVGCFNTQNQKLRFFDKETDMTFEEWRKSEACQLLNRINFRPAEWVWEDEMSEEEKREHPEYKTTGGYLKIYDNDNTTLCKEWWNELTEREKQIIKNIPNFDAEKFFIITGIRVD